ncbi:MAG: energy transducer TonB [Bacteroidales bacterium]|nr:energy transducer TonB [Bacteroidales bacterium]
MDYLHNILKNHIFGTLLIFVLCILPLTSLPQNFIQAIPYGGQPQLKQFIKEEMVYPQEAIDNQIQGAVGVFVSIDETGKVTNMEIFESVDPLIDAEALRILRKILWDPASYSGVASSSNYSVRIKFNIKKYFRNVKERGYADHLFPFRPVDQSNIIYNYNEVNSIPKLIFTSPSMTLAKFITKNIEYPKEAMQYNLTGTQTINFVIEPNGRVSNIRPKEYVGAGCCEEAVRLVKLLNWYPGIKNGKAVRVRSGISIQFNLSDDTDIQFVPTFLNNSWQ